jgi:hypothetical protein
MFVDVRIFDQNAGTSKGNECALRFIVLHYKWVSVEEAV